MRNRIVLLGAISSAVVSTVAMAAETPRVTQPKLALDNLVYGATAWGRWGLRRFKPTRLDRITRFARWGLSLRHRRIDVCRIVYCYHPNAKDQVAEAKPTPPKLPKGLTPRVTRYGAL